MGILDHLTCLPRNLYAGQEAIVRTLYGTTDWFRIEKGLWQGCLLSPCLFNLYAKHIMNKCWAGSVTSWNQDSWENHQQPQICGCYHSNSRWRETKEPLERVKEESDRAGSKVNVKKTKIVPSGSITSWQIKGGKCEGSDRFPLIGF